MIITTLLLPLGHIPFRLPEQKLATYFKLKSPDSNSVPGVTQSFAAFRTYKDKIPVFLRVPSASTGIFLRIVDTEIYW
jgi:hypothetical protein